MSETTARDARRLEKFTTLLLEVAEKAENNFPSGVIFFAFLDASVRYAARFVRPGELAKMLRNMADDLDDVQRAQQPVDPTQFN